MDVNSSRFGFAAGVRSPRPTLVTGGVPNRVFSTALVFFLLALALLGQTDRGTMTGTISDPAGAVVANAAIEARNTETGSVYQVASSATGNYTIPNLPTGTYELSVTVAGFKKFVRAGLVIQAAQTIRVDAAMEVGSATESVTVTEAAPLLKTESGELSNTVATKTMDTLPLLSVGSNSSGIRNPFNLVALLPGAFYQPSPSFTGPTVRINGGVSGSEKVLVDGMDGTNILGQGANQQNQPGMDSIQEWTVQTSNYSAEFGQAGSAVMNVTMKSGTNQYHGSLYEYFQNDILNAGQPFTVQKGSPNEHNRPTVRRNDYGLTLGGPVDIPKVYNGRDKTFFFFSWEQFLQNQNFLPGTVYGSHGGVSQRRLQRRDYGGRQQEPRGRSDGAHHPCQHHLRSAHAACRKWPARHRSIPGQHHPAGAV